MTTQTPPPPLPLNPASTPWGLIALLVAVTAISPLSLNILMPAVPRLATELHTDVATVQLTLSLYLIGMAVSQLVVGPLSDRFGRRPVILGGLLLTALASFAAIAAASISQLILARTFQALGASTGLVVGRAMIRDLYDRERAASMIAWVTMAMVVSPMVAPSIGGLIDTFFGWPAIFGFVGIAALAVYAWSLSALKETRLATATFGGFEQMYVDARSLLRNRHFLGYVGTCTFGSAIFFAFLGGAPHVVITLMGRSSAEYGAWFAVGALGYMGGNFIVGRYSTLVGVRKIVRWGVLGGVAACALSVAAVWAFPGAGPIALFTPQLLIGVANGLVLPTSIAGAISVRPQAAGTASGITGFLQMIVGAGVAQFASMLLAGANTALPLVLVMFAMAVLSAISFIAGVRRG